MDFVWPSTSSAAYQAAEAKRFLTGVEKDLYGEANLEDPRLHEECDRWRSKHVFMRLCGKAIESESHEFYTAQRNVVARRLIQHFVWNQICTSLQSRPNSSQERIESVPAKKAQNQAQKAAPSTRLPRVAK